MCRGRSIAVLSGGRDHINAEKPFFQARWTWRRRSDSVGCNTIEELLLTRSRDDATEFGIRSGRLKSWFRLSDSGTAQQLEAGAWQS